MNLQNGNWRLSLAGVFIWYLCPRMTLLKFQIRKRKSLQRVSDLYFDLTLHWNLYLEMFNVKCVRKCMVCAWCIILVRQTAHKFMSQKNKLLSRRFFPLQPLLTNLLSSVVHYFSPIADFFFSLLVVLKMSINVIAFKRKWISSF